MRTCAADDCSERFQPINNRQRFCSNTCKGRVNMRRMRAKNGDPSPEPPKHRAHSVTRVQLSDKRVLELEVGKPFPDAGNSQCLITGIM
jgi:hypothetical protein